MSGRQDLLLGLGISLVVANAVANGALQTIWNAVKGTGKSATPAAGSTPATGAVVNSNAPLAGAANVGNGIDNLIGAHPTNPTPGSTTDWINTLDGYNAIERGLFGRDPTAQPAPPPAAPK